LTATENATIFQKQTTQPGDVTLCIYFRRKKKPETKEKKTGRGATKKIGDYLDDDIRGIMMRALFAGYFGVWMQGGWMQCKLDMQQGNVQIRRSIRCDAKYFFFGSWEG